jgi:hypothetical protein
MPVTDTMISGVTVPNYTIDRLENGEWAVLEDEQGRTFTVPRAWLPGGVREGDIIAVSDAPGGDARLLRFVIDQHERDERLAEARRRRAQLPRGPKGDVSL